MQSLADRTLAVLRRHRFGGPGVVAVSGGPDSVALAAILHELVPRREIPAITLAHLNHGLRGEESDGDEAFVRTLGESWAMPVVTTRIDVAAFGGNMEDAARTARYAWLQEVAAAQNANWIATGHTADDQAETVLHRLLRGSGLAGLRGIHECRGAIVRPLLSVRRRELIAYLTEAGIAYRIDSTNADRRRTRNRLRHDVIPLLEAAVDPAIVDVLARTAAEASECHTAVTRVADEWRTKAERPRAGEVLVFSRDVLIEAGPFWAREVFRSVWRREGWPMAAMHANDWHRFDSLVNGDIPRHDFPGVTAKAVRRVIQLHRPV